MELEHIAIVLVVAALVVWRWKQRWKVSAIWITYGSEIDAEDEQNGTFDAAFAVDRFAWRARRALFADLDGQGVPEKDRLSCSRWRVKT